MISYIQILQYIEAFAYQHMQIQRFGADFFEQIENFSSKGKNFPILYVVPVDNTSEENIKRWTIDVYCFDIIEKSRDNINTIVSDTELILNDLVLWFRDGELNIDLGNNPVKLPLNNKLLDFCAGHSMRLQLITDQSTICEIPFRDVPELINNVCDIQYNYNCGPALVTNSDNSFALSIPSGITEVLDDINVNINGVFNSTHPSAIDIDITLGQNIITNSEGAILAELNPEENYEIEDATRTLNGNSWLSIPAENIGDITLKDQNNNIITPLSFNENEIVIESNDVVLDSDAQNFINATGITDQLIITAINDYVIYLKSKGIWETRKVIYPMVGGTAFTHSFNLKDPTKYQLSFFGGWIHSATGAKPNGINAYADTDLSLGLDFVNFRDNNYMEFYANTTNTMSGGWNLGVGNTNTGFPLYGLAISRANSFEFIYDCGNSNTNRIFVTLLYFPTKVGNYAGNKSLLLNASIFKYGFSLATNSTTPTGMIPNETVYIGAMRGISGSPNYYMDNECSGCSIGTGLTIQQVKESEFAIEQLNQKLNRGV